MLTEVDMLTECMMVSLLQMTTTVSEVTPQWSSHYRGLFPQRSSAILQYYDTFHFRYHGFPAVLPLFPLPCSSLARDEELHQPDQFTATVLLTMQVMTMAHYTVSSCILTDSCNPSRQAVQLLSQVRDVTCLMRYSS